MVISQRLEVRQQTRVRHHQSTESRRHRSTDSLHRRFERRAVELAVGTRQSPTSAPSPPPTSTRAKANHRETRRAGESRREPRGRRTASPPRRGVPRREGAPRATPGTRGAIRTRRRRRRRLRREGGRRDVRAEVAVAGVELDGAIVSAEPHAAVSAGATHGTDEEFAVGIDEEAVYGPRQELLVERALAPRAERAEGGFEPGRARGEGRGVEVVQQRRTAKV